MIANTTLTNNLGQTLRYVMGKATQTIYANFTAGLSGDVAKMVEAMAATAATHRSTRMQRVGYHISLSPAIEDHLTDEDWMHLAQDFIEELDAEAHQVVAALHDDTTYLDCDRTRVHAHFVINRPSNCGSLNLTYPQIERVVRQLEQNYQLTAVPCSWEVHYQKGQTMSSPPTTTSPLQLEQLLSPSVQNYLQGERGQSRAEYAVCHTARECYGWQSWCQSNGIELGGNPEVLIGQSAEAMGVASEQVAGILSGLDPAQRVPSAVYKGGDVAAWRHIAKLDRSLFEEKCPPELSEQVRQSLRSFAQDTTSEEGVRPLQTMGEVMRSAQPSLLNANPNARHLPASPVARVGQVLTYTGEHLTRQADEVDGRTVIGATTALTGAALILGDRILQSLQTPEGKDYSERVDRIVADLQGIEERTGAIETQHRANRIDGVNDQLEEVEERTVALEEQLGETTSEVSSSPEESRETGTTPDETAQAHSEASKEAKTASGATVQTSSEASQESEQEQDRESTASVEVDEVEFPFEERLSQLEQAYQVTVQPDEFPPIHIDRSAPIDRQLDQIEAAIAQFKTRLERLEAVVFPQQESQQEGVTVTDKDEAEVGTVNSSSSPHSQVNSPTQSESHSPHHSPEPQPISPSSLGQSSEESERSPEALSGEAIAERLYNYTCARAKVYGLHPQDPVNTTMGVIRLTSESAPIISLADEQYGTKFEAGFVNGKWNVVTNDFSPTEMSRLEDIPQTPEAYTQQANAKDLIRYFQTNLPQEFQKEQGRIVWEDEQGQPKYEFEITSRHPKQNIVGRQGDEVVFFVQMDAAGILRTQTCQIPTEQIDTLLHPPITQVKQTAL